MPLKKFLLVVLIFFSCFYFLFKNNFFILKLSAKLKQATIEYFKEKNTQFMYFEALYTLIYCVQFVFSIFYSGLNLDEQILVCFICSFYLFISRFLTCLTFKF